MTVAPVLAAVFEAQNVSRLCRWLGKCCTGREKLVRKAMLEGAYIQHALCIVENKPPPPSGAMSTTKKGGGTYFREDMVHVSA